MNETNESFPGAGNQNPQPEGTEPVMLDQPTDNAVTSSNQTASTVTPEPVDASAGRQPLTDTSQDQVEALVNKLANLTEPPVIPADATPEDTLSSLYQWAKDWLKESPEKIEELKNNVAGFLSHSNDLNGTIKAAEMLIGGTFGTAYDIANKLVDFAKDHLERTDNPHRAPSIPEHVDNLIKHGDDPGALFQALDKWLNESKSPEVTEDLRMVVSEAIARKGAGEGMDPAAIATSLGLALPNSTDPDRNHDSVANRAFHEVNQTPSEGTDRSGPSITESISPKIESMAETMAETMAR